MFEYFQVRHIKKPETRGPTVDHSVACYCTLVLKVPEHGTCGSG